MTEVDHWKSLDGTQIQCLDVVLVLSLLTLAKFPSEFRSADAHCLVIHRATHCAVLARVCAAWTKTWCKKYDEFLKTFSFFAASNEKTKQKYLIFISVFIVSFYLFIIFLSHTVCFCIRYIHGQITRNTH